MYQQQQPVKSRATTVRTGGKDANATQVIDASTMQPSKNALFVGASKDEKDPNFDITAKQERLDDDVLKKIEDFKEKYQTMKDKATDNEKELAYSTIKVEELVQKIKEIE